MLRLNTLILFFFIAFGAIAQNDVIRIVEGSLVDSQQLGEPIAFATIGIVGSSLGTSSNAEGFFSLIRVHGSNLEY
jgi:hypothetical protein